MKRTGLNLSEILFLIWAGIILAWWAVSVPESAPQQAALAGQALVLICIPYCVLSVLQRSWAARAEKHPQEADAPLQLTTPLRRTR